MPTQDHESWKKRVKGHRQRLRDRFLKYGIDSFTDSDIVELLLTFGTPRTDCKEAARGLLKHFGNLHGVLEAPMEELIQIKGVGPKNAIALKFVHEVARRFLRERLLRKDLIRCAQDVVDYLFHLMSFKDREVFVVVLLDPANQVIDVKELFSGTVDKAAIYPREIVRLALSLNAKGIILAHNHPSGWVNPSEQDILATKRIILAASAMDIVVMDHIIIGDVGRYYSFDTHGVMARLKHEVDGILNAL